MGREFDIDGYRCDVAGWVPVDFWNDARRALDKIKPVFMLAEDEGEKLHDFAFDMTYGWEFHHIMNEVAKKHMNADSIIAYFERERKRFASNAYRLHFTSNHDENSWNGTEYERMGKGAECFAVLSSTIHGMPLIYNGQESSFNRRLEFFEKDSIDWGTYDKNGFYNTLFKFKKENPALWNGDFGAFPEFIETGNPNVLLFKRVKSDNCVIGLFNLSESKQNVKFKCDNCKGTYNELFSDESFSMSCKKNKVSLDAWEFKVYSTNE